MIILTTSKNKTNDYFNNTQMNAIVHLQREIDASENGNPVTITVEELGTIKRAVGFSRKKIDGDIENTLPTVTYSGNTLTLSTVTGGDIFTLFVIGSR